MQRKISTLMSDLQAILDSDGDLNVEVEAEVKGLDGKFDKVQAKAHTVMVQHVDGAAPKVVISSNDGVES